MSVSKFKRVLWTLNELVKASSSGISMNELSDKWANSPMNDEKEPGIPERTFHRLRRNVESIFDVEIECVKGIEPRYRVSSNDLGPGDGNLYNLILNKATKDEKSKSVREILGLILLGADIPSGDMEAVNEDSKSKCKTLRWALVILLSPSGEGMPKRRGRPKPPPRADSSRTYWQYKIKRETEVSLRLTNFVLLMYRQLTSQQRSQIFALLQRKTSREEIALIVGCSQSTLCRELKRNSTTKGHYLWEKAHAKALERRKRTTSNNKLDSVLVWRIKQMIIDHQWSPEQIRGVLAKEGVSVSIQTIYNIINADESGELRRHRRHPDFRRRPKGERKPTKATNIPNRTSIHDRPAEVDGKRFGDFEMDLIVDAYGHAILVLLERMTGFVMMEKLPYGKRAKPLSKTVVRMLYAYRKYLKTITTDNGSEFAAHLDITAGLRIKGLDDVTVYFADSYCSWQKGAVENINKLIRQYIPKKSNFNDFTDLYIKNVAKKLNLRPRKKLGFRV